MGEAKRRPPERLPRRMWAIVFEPGHYLADQVVRSGREAAIYFTEAEAKSRRGNLIEEEKIPSEGTVIVQLHIKKISAMVKPA